MHKPNTNFMDMNQIGLRYSKVYSPLDLICTCSSRTTEHPLMFEMADICKNRAAGTDKLRLGLQINITDSQHLD